MTKKSTKEDQQFRVSKNEKIFALVKDQDGKIVICAGGYAVSQKRFETFEQADAYIATKPYEIMFNMYYILNKLENETNQQNPQNE